MGKRREMEVSLVSLQTFVASSKHSLHSYPSWTLCLLLQNLLSSMGRDVGYADYPEKESGLVVGCTLYILIHTSVLSLFLEFAHVIDLGDIFRKKKKMGGEIIYPPF